MPTTLTVSNATNTSPTITGLESVRFATEDYQLHVINDVCVTPEENSPAASACSRHSSIWNLHCSTSAPPTERGVNSSPTPSVATQTAELGEGSPDVNPALRLCKAIQDMNDACGERAADQDTITGMVEVVRGLVAEGDAYWEAQHATRNRKHRSVSATANLNVIRSTVTALRDSGLLSTPVAVTATMYLRRLSALNKGRVSHLTIHRHLVAAAVVANKVCSDNYYTLDTYTTACNIAKSTIAAAEISFLTHLNYDVQFQLRDEGRASHDLPPLGFEETENLIHHALFE